MPKKLPTKPSNHSPRWLVVQITHSSSAPRRMASSMLQAVLNTASMYVSPSMRTGGNQIGSEPVATRWSSVSSGAVTGRSSCFEKL